MNTTVNMRSFLVLLACTAIGLFGASVQAHAGTTEVNGTTNWVAGSDSEYHTIIDFTQGGSDNVVVSNTQTTGSARRYPYTASDTDPWAAINPAHYPPGYTAGAPDLYVNVKFDNSDVRSSSLSTATINTCDQGDPTKCPTGTLPTTFFHRLGTYSSSSGTVTALTNTKLTGGTEVLNNMFTKNGQAFDMDRIRYAANRLWYEWYQEKTGVKTGPWTGFTYQPTGTMSFENFVNNIVNHHPMYGIVRVVIPVETQGGSGKTVGDMYLDPSYPVGGAEFTSPPTWVGTGTRSSQPVMVDYEAMWPGTSVPSSANKSWKREPYSGTVTVYGMLLIDYVDSRTYDPAHFFDGAQDYVDNYSSQATHDAVATDAVALANIKNYILPRSSGRNVVLMDWDTLDINPIDDLVKQVQYTDTATAGSDGRMDTLDIIRRKYMMNGKTNYQASEISDDYVFEYWMRQAMQLPTGNSTRDQIITDLTGNPPGNTGTTPPSVGQFDFSTEKFNSGASELANFDSGYQGMGWPSMTEPDQFHAYFPSGYEVGWIRAFWNLDLAALDATTTEGTPGSWWMHLPDDVGSTQTDLTGSPVKTKAYAEFGVPSSADNWITISLDKGATQQSMPNFYSTDWEDFPAFAFAGGLLDVHGFMNCSGMLYTPDSLEIEAHSGSELPGGSSSAGPFQYENGAMLVGNGFYLQDQNTNDHSMIAISYNYNSFDRLRSGAASLTITGATNIAELQGQ